MRMDRDERDGLDPEGADDPHTEIDTGEPIAQLRDLALSTSPRFLSRVRGRIDRRLLWRDVAVFSLSGLAHTTFEYLAMFFHFLQPGDHGDEREGGDGADPD